jgi:regulator of protease activity HflC (stomatin/prohibitin superfamily)
MISQSAINVAQGRKEAVILESEASKQRQINQAIGEAEAIERRAKATAALVNELSAAISKNKDSAHDAIMLSVAEKYVNAFGNIAKEGNTLIVPSNAGDAASMVAQIMSIYKSQSNKA